MSDVSMHMFEIKKWRITTGSRWEIACISVCIRNGDAILTAACFRVGLHYQTTEETTTEALLRRPRRRLQL